MFIFLLAKNNLTYLVGGMGGWGGCGVVGVGGAVGVHLTIVSPLALHLNRYISYTKGQFAKDPIVEV